MDNQPIRFLKSLQIVSFLLVFSVVSTLNLKANDSIPTPGGHHEEKSFNAGEMIIDHVSDAHDWHIMDIGEHAVSIPLPIILFDNEGLHIFMSSRFEHGHASYDGFMLSKEGEFAGKIVPVLEGTMEIDSSKEIPLDFSITKTVAGIFVAAILLLLIFLSIAKAYKKRQDLAPKGLQSFLEPIILFVRDDVAKASIGKKKYEKYMPFLLTVFFFILINNALGLIPIFPAGANVTGNIAVTLVLAVFTFIVTTISGNGNYWKHILWPPVPHALKILMVPIEIIGMFIKPFVLMVRLFANILAGHIVILGFISMIFIFGAMNAYMGYGVSILSVAFSLFISLLEILVAFIQAYVFTLLSALYIGMATEEHH